MNSILTRSAFQLRSVNLNLTVAAPSIGAIRFYPAIASSKTPQKPKSGQPEPEKSVFISQSTDIYTNLALEHWLYRHYDFSKHRVLLLFQNDPCITIGRHQNPWTEVDLVKAKENGVNLIRRPSGGGTAYYDQGNLNCTFYSPPHSFDRKSNLEIICNALNREFGVRTEITPKFDINYDGFMIGGSVSKLSRNAYQHCTLLVDADLEQWSRLLNSNIVSSESRAIESVKTGVENLKNVYPAASLKKALASIGYEFLRTSLDGSDGGEKLIEKQRGFKMISPSEDWFPGLDALIAELKGWSWTYGATPECTYKKEYLLNSKNGGEPIKVQLHLHVRKGFVQSANLELPAKMNIEKDFVDGRALSDLSGFVNAVKQRPFNAELLGTFERLLFNKSNGPLNVHEMMDMRTYKKLHTSYGF